MAKMGFYASVALNVCLAGLLVVMAYRASSGNLASGVAGPESHATMRMPTQSLRRSLRMHAADTKAADTKTETETYTFTAPALDPNTPMPRFQGNTGGLLRSASFQEFYAITFESPKEQIFEMPTGGAAEMRKGPNLVKFARKEQCLALLTQLRTKFKINGNIYRIDQAAGGEVTHLHPKDGIYPEKVHPGAATSRGPPKLYTWESEPLAGPPLRNDVPRWAYGDDGQLAPTPLFFLWPFIYFYKLIFSEPPQYRYSDPEKLKIGPPEDWDMSAYYRE
uniref:Photosystem I reaction center subunit II n=1 Tax=Gymnochlora stellata TaxID=67809 RepID=B5A4J0_GYMST|nr:photosystem I reaction center subunit II [Gymnochlora stellata]